MSKSNKNKIIKFNNKTKFNITVLFILFIVVYIIVQLFLYNNKKETPYFEVKKGSNDDEVSQIFQGIAIRKELIQKSKDGGYVDYFVDENSRVSKNTILYSVDSSGKLKEKLDNLNTKDSALTEENIETISENLYEFSNSYDDMNFYEIYNFKSSIRGKIIDLVNRNSLNKINKKTNHIRLIKQLLQVLFYIEQMGMRI